MITNPYFLDSQGNVVKAEGIYSHVGIAMKYLDDHPELKEAFRNSNIKYENDFLIERLGFIQVTDDEGNGYYRKKIVFSACVMTPYQKGVIMQYIADGFEADNVDRISESRVRRFHDYQK